MSPSHLVHKTVANEHANPSQWRDRTGFSPDSLFAVRHIAQTCAAFIPTVVTIHKWDKECKLCGTSFDCALGT
jgi:hypothetical protein